jgi:hypothetical protein
MCVCVQVEEEKLEHYRAERKSVYLEVWYFCTSKS